MRKSVKLIVLFFILGFSITLTYHFIKETFFPKPLILQIEPSKVYDLHLDGFGWYLTGLNLDNAYALINKLKFHLLNATDKLGMVLYAKKQIAKLNKAGRPSYIEIRYHIVNAIICKGCLVYRPRNPPSASLKLVEVKLT